MTPTSAKPEPGLIADPDAPEPEISVNDETGAVAVSEKAGGARRRAGSVALHVAARRAESDDADAKGTRGAKTGARNGPRAQYRAAQAALGEGSAAGVDPGDIDPADEGNDPQQSGPTRDTAQIDREADRAGSDPLPSPAMSVGLAKTDPSFPIRSPGPQSEPVQGEIITDEDDDDDEDDRRGGGRRRMGGRGEKRAAKAAKNNDAANYVVAPTVSMAQIRPRHYGVMALFALMVLLPTLSYGFYMWTKAADRYESNVGFGSRTEEAPSPFALLGALGGAAQSGSSDMDILYEFIVSQELVAKLDQQLDLKAIYAKAKDDPLNRFAEGGTIEDLVAYWKRMVLINYDSATGLMTLRVFAFDPADAKKIAEAILVESTRIINELSMTAQVDTTRYSKDALATTEQRLSDARLAVLDYQIKNNVVDPTTAIATQNGVIGTLNQQLATAQIDLDMLTGTVGTSDVRIATLNRRIEVIRNRIAEE
ncbi:MAG: hypothetical protein H7245_16090 [Candidatus Saccharibacteria bacterium]|nr:hypothetical protein [Pseudorhodobacter sp.]